MRTGKFFRMAATFVTVLAINCSIILPSGITASAEMSEQDIRDKIDQIQQENEDRRAEIDRLDSDIAEDEEKRDEVLQLLGEQKQLVDYYYNLIYLKNADIDEIQAQLDDLYVQIDDKNAAIDKAQEAIDEMDKENEENLEKFAQIVRAMYTQGNDDMFGVLADSQDFYSLMVNAEVLGNITEKNLEFMQNLQAGIKKSQADKKALETDKTKLLELVNAAETTKTDLEYQKGELDTLLYDCQTQADKYESDYNDYQSSIDQKEAEQNSLQYLISISESEIESYEEQLKELIKSQMQADKVMQEGEWIWPVPGRSYISCPFGWDADFGRWHKGVDVGDSGIHGDAVLASKAGTVIVAESSYIPGYSYGMYVVIDHGSGFTTTYAHLSGVNVYVGQEVAQGDVVGYVGNTGWSTGPHLHFEIRTDGEPVDPFGYVTIA